MSIPATTLTPRNDVGPWHSSWISVQSSIPDYQHMHYGGHSDHTFHANDITDPVVPPYTYEDAQIWDDFPIWKQAMEVEMVQHTELGTLEKVDLPPGCDAIGSYWVFAVKTNSQGKFELGKA